MPIAEAIGLGAAVDFLARSAWTQCASTSATLAAYALERLRAVPGVTMHGPPTRAARQRLSFALDGVHPHDVAEILGREGVCVRAGHHCAQVLMQRLGVAATSRARSRCTPRATTSTAWSTALGARAGGVRSDGRPLPRAHPRALQAARTTGRAPSSSDPDLEFEDNNPLCGDELKVQLEVGERRPDRRRALLRATAARSPRRGLDGLRRGGRHAGRRPLRLDRDFVLDLLGIDISATRMKCALLEPQGAQGRRPRARRGVGSETPAERRGAGEALRPSDRCGIAGNPTCDSRS